MVICRLPHAQKSEHPRWSASDQDAILLADVTIFSMNKFSIRFQYIITQEKSLDGYWMNAIKSRNLDIVGLNLIESFEN